MAVKPASSVAAKEQTELPDEGKSDQVLQGALNDFLRSYNPSATMVNNAGLLLNRFRVELAEPLPEYDSKTAKAYNVSDISGEYKKLYALVINHGRVFRMHAIERLKSLRHPNLISLVAAGNVEFSSSAEERFVIVYERPAGQKLSQILASKTIDLNDYFIVNNIISPLISIINELAELNLPHGSINLDKIYFLNEPVLGDMLSEPCGYSQPFYCEPIERMMCLPAGKGEGSPAQDYYAMAVVVMALQFGLGHFSGMTQNGLIKTIVREGAYFALLRNKDTSLMMDEFYRGTIGQDVLHRWNYRYLKSWVDGRRSSAVVLRNNNEVLKPFEYTTGGIEIAANSRAELAHSFYMHWDHMPDILRGGSLNSWMVINLRNKELVSEINHISKTVSSLDHSQSAQIAEQCMRFILLLDPQGPIRFGTLVFHLDGLAALCAELYLTQSEKELSFFTRFIELDMARFWRSLQNPDIPLTQNITEVLNKLDKLRLLVRNSALGFGVERLLYELNPQLSCQSPLFANNNITSLKNLLLRLDQLAPNFYAQQDPIDKHIAAYIGQKLSLQGEIKLHELTAMASLATNRSIIALRFLAKAQSKAGSIKLPGLSHWLGSRILPSLNIIRSKTLRGRLKNALLQKSQSGALPMLEDLIIEESYSRADKNGYQRARQSYAQNINKIAAYRMPEIIDRDSTLTGAAFAKSVSYFVFFVILFFSLRDGL